MRPFTAFVASLVLGFSSCFQSPLETDFGRGGDHLQSGVAGGTAPAASGGGVAQATSSSPNGGGVGFEAACQGPGLPVQVIFEEPGSSIPYDLAVVQPGVLSLLRLADGAGTLLDQRFDTHGTVLGRTSALLGPPPSLYSFGGRSFNDLGIALVVGGELPSGNIFTSLMSAGSFRTVMDFPEPTRTPNVVPTWNARRRVWDLFWSDYGNHKVGFVTRFEDGGVGMARDVVSGSMLASPVVGLMGSTYLVPTMRQGASSEFPTYAVRAVTDDGQLLATLPIDGAPSRVLSGPTNTAAIVIDHWDGGSPPRFSEVNLASGALQLGLTVTPPPGTQIVWDPRRGVWHFVWSRPVDRSLWLGTVAPGQGIVRVTPVSCNFVDSVTFAMALDGEQLYVGFVGEPGPVSVGRSGVLKIDL